MAASEPMFGSLSAKQAIASPLRIRGRYFSRRAALPYSASTNEARLLTANTLRSEGQTRATSAISMP
ncbi:hypothetical protein D9M70_585840 [compost metagenome]